MNYWELIADKLSREGWSWGKVGYLESGRPMHCLDAHRDGQKFIVRSDDLLAGFVELQAACEGVPAITQAFRDAIAESIRLGTAVSLPIPWEDVELMKLLAEAEAHRSGFELYAHPIPEGIEIVTCTDADDVETWSVTFLVDGRTTTDV